jgi:alkylated DNA nucleotide flippase Atl1
MKTDVQTPMEVFFLPQHLVVPLFQRPYVWDEEGQWAPLWQDIRRLAELRLRDPSSGASHFLGAVVLQAHEIQVGHIPVSNIIDGQQRLTTLQILMDATAAVLDERDFELLAGQLEGLTHNQANFVPQGESFLKVRHTNRDLSAFTEVMNAEPPVDHSVLKHAGSLIVQAHKFFASAVDEWLGDSSSEGHAQRADALVVVLTRCLQLVVINLGANENSQEIFETLNARGTPLTAADLIKNYVFQRLEAEGVDTKRAYAHDWPFDSKFWETEISVGRYLVSRSSLFLNQWLVSRVGDEIGPQSSFTRFKSYVEHDSGQPMSELLPMIKEQADLYAAWTTSAADKDRQLTPVEMAIYRMQANGIEILKPLLIWLHSPDRAVPETVINDVVAIAESWVVRRMLLRLTGSDLGRIVADIIRVHRDAPAPELPDRVRSHLMRLNVSSTYWPGDEEIRTALSGEPVYLRFKRGRLRMMLEAVENRFRMQTNQPQIPRRGFPIEHILPQKWESNWPVDGLEAQQDRAIHVHRLGNLTLLTGLLNSKVSNGPWADKREAFREHDTMLLTSRLLRTTDGRDWDEASIDARTVGLVEELLRIWYVPAGHIGVVVNPEVKEAQWVEVKHLVIAGLLTPGARLVPRPGKWASAEALVRADGLLEIDNKTFDSPSGAANHLRGSATNGWYFWRLEDGRTLRDVRTAYLGEDSRKTDLPFDWSPLHAILEALPEGRWTSYGNLAAAIGTAAQPLGNHITNCLQCANAHRVLKSDGSIASNFAWADPTDACRPIDMLQAEGIIISSGKASPEQELTSAEVLSLING